ncbi:heme biosynthesis protein HemY [Lonepinella koalarum]|uniref:HemY protein n=1 Tax=Lonepinella koalarum TaxID=53417 RepID=A0A4R1KRB7_9PAST|nr:heme biosynthesis protein HemY [Lonepinella koalarum]MDH2925686.1 heme biosynthesis protein HemY [Lonepinella koalarum]TCK67117.1 HemY protein [Lonepinella koalarum]TFJ88895.1 heme biosynthesis protein HemY [Lonepinella koalarum]
MFRILFLMLVLLAGLIAGPYLAGKQGYVLIQTVNTNYELSLVTLVVFFVIAMAVVYVIEWLVRKFFRLSNSTYGWFSRRKRVKAQKQTLQGLIKMDEGNYSKAEKLIAKNAKHSDEPILNFIKAAEAAQQHGDDFNANKYLMEATQLAGSDNLAVELARTRILLLQHKLPAARSSVDSLLVMDNRNPEVLKLAVEIYQQSEAYEALDQILPVIESTNMYSSPQFTALQRDVANGLLDEIMNEEGADGLLAWWQDQPRKRHNDHYVRIGLIQRLIDCNDHESAYDLSVETLKKLALESDLNSALYAQITRLQASDSSKLIKLLQKRVKNSEESGACCAYRALGYLYVRNAEFDNAADVFKKVVAHKDQLEPNDITMATYVFEQVGEQERAKQLRDEVLKSAMAIDTVALKTTENADRLLLEPAKN